MPTESDHNEGGERTFTKSEFERAIKDRLRKSNEEIEMLRTELSDRPTSESFSELKHQLDALKEEQEMAGKDALERAEHKYQKQDEARQRQIDELQGKISELNTGLQERDSTIVRDRVTYAVGDALDRSKVFPRARGDALRVLVSELRDVQVSDDKSVRATWGDHVDAAPEVIAEAFLKERPHYLSAEAGGGAGSRRSNAGGTGKPQNLLELSDRELLEMSHQQKQ